MIEMFASAAAAADAAAHGIADALTTALNTRGRATLVATGGRAPGPVYDRLKDVQLDWARVVVTLSDERCVSAEDPASNARLVRERLLAGAASKAAFVPLWRQAPSPEAAAEALEPALRALVPFDAVVLGMGEDGHVASLIPGSPILAQGMDPAGGRLALAVPPGHGSPPLARITLTLPALLQARAIFLLVAGDAKREVIAQARAGADLPVRALLAQDRVPVRILWAPKHQD